MYIRELLTPVHWSLAIGFMVKLTYVYLLLLDVWFGVKCDWPGFCE